LDPREKILTRKVLGKVTEWSIDPIPPRWSVYPKARSTPPGWVWRAAQAATPAGEDFILLVRGQGELDKWNAWLILLLAGGKSVIIRLEQHGSTGEGIHIHANCGESRHPLGPESIQACEAVRLPEKPMEARRINPWTRDSFWDYACDTFRIRREEQAQGDLGFW
jgi:hypothetical protein